MITELVEAGRMCRELPVSLRPAINLKIIRRPQQNSYLQNMSGLLNRFAVGHKQSCGLKAFPRPTAPSAVQQPNKRHEIIILLPRNLELPNRVQGT